MAENGKGLNGWTRWLVGTLFTVFFFAITTLTGHVIANEQNRVKDDTEIRKELNTCVKEQMLTNQQILISLAEIKMEIRKVNND